MHCPEWALGRVECRGNQVREGKGLPAWCQPESEIFLASHLSQTKTNTPGLLSLHPGKQIRKERIKITKKILKRESTKDTRPCPHSLAIYGILENMSLPLRLRCRSVLFSGVSYQRPGAGGAACAGDRAQAQSYTQQDAVNDASDA